MKSRAKLTYGGVARALGFTDQPAREPLADAMKQDLHVAYELSRLLRGKRLKRGALDFDLPEAKIVLDSASGRPTDVTRRSQDPGMKKAYQLIEELMLLANEVVARWLEGQKVPAIYRVHAPPDEQKLERFATMCETLGIPFDVDSTKDPKLLAKLLASYADHPLADVLNNLLLRSMKQATYDVVNIGHFGLASKAYLHFTSPIRRYPDLVVHRVVHDVLLGRRRGAPDPKETVALGEAALASSLAERRAMEIERAVVDLYRAVLMRDRIGQEYEGRVSALVGSGVFVALDAPFVDVLVRLEDLGGDRYELDDEGLRVVAQRSGDVIALGDRMRLTVVDVSILRRSVYGRRLGGVSDERRRERGPRVPPMRDRKGKPQPHVQHARPKHAKHKQRKGVGKPR
jgi:ribonuclease R